MVSVVVPFLDPPAAFFREAVDSIRRQDYADWELLLADDGSSEETHRLVREIVQVDPARIRHVQHPGGAHAGKSATRNLGLRNARGEYVAFLDADDVWQPIHLSRSVRVLDRFPEVAMTYSGFVKWRSWGGSGEGSTDEPVEQPEPYEVPIQPPDLLLNFLQNKGIPCSGGIVVRRDVALEVGGFAESVDKSEDQTLPYRLAIAHPVSVLPGCDWLYRQHPQSQLSLRKRSGMAMTAHLELIEWIGDLLREQRVRDRRVWASFRHLRRIYLLLALRHTLVPYGLRRRFRALAAWAGSIPLFHH